jgi:hypothetical protein
MGLHVNDVVIGYTKASAKAQELLEGMDGAVLDCCCHCIDCILTMLDLSF